MKQMILSKTNRNNELKAAAIKNVKDGICEDCPEYMERITTSLFMLGYESTDADLLVSDIGWSKAEADVICGYLKMIEKNRGRKKESARRWIVVDESRTEDPETGLVYGRKRLANFAALADANNDAAERHAANVAAGRTSTVFVYSGLCTTNLFGRFAPDADDDGYQTPECFDSENLK